MRKSAAVAPAATSPGAWGVGKGVIWKAPTVEGWPDARRWTGAARPSAAAMAAIVSAPYRAAP
ncbi:hypothetical protein D3C80_1598650 [compost metagenome]